MTTVDDKVINVESTEVQGTPFMLIKRTENDETKWFGVLGNHRLTPMYDSPDEAHDDILSITWDRITAVVYITLEHYVNKLEGEIKAKVS